MRRPLVVTGDPTQLVLDYLDRLTGQVPDLTGFTVDTMIPAGVTPREFIRVRVLGQTEIARGGLTEADVQVQVWAAGDQRRRSIAHQLLAHLRAGLRTTTITGPVDLPDRVDETVQLTQIVVGLTVKGTQS